MRALALVLLVVECAGQIASCGSHTDCASCTAAKWAGVNCRWCPLSYGSSCQSHIDVNQCPVNVQISDTDKCPGQAPGTTKHELLPEAMKPDLHKYALEAQASYCPSAQVKAWSCSWCKDLGATYNVVVAAHDLGVDGQMYVAYTDDRVIIVFKGSSNIQNWISNVQFVPVNMEWMNDNNIRAHLGFVDAYKALRDQVLAGLEEAQEKCGPKCKVQVIGHSLGGAQATVCVSDLVKTKGIVPEVFTFGSPRVGNAAFVEWWKSSNIPTHRVVNRRDLVPHVPLDEGMGFKHVPREVWQKSADLTVMCDSTGEDPACAGSIVGSSIEDHISYTGTVASDVCPGSNDPVPSPPATDSPSTQEMYSLAGKNEGKTNDDILWAAIAGGLALMGLVGLVVQYNLTKAKRAQAAEGGVEAGVEDHPITPGVQSAGAAQSPYQTALGGAGAEETECHI